MFLSVDGGRSRIFSSGTTQGARRRHFLVLMVDAPGSLASAPPRGPVVDIFTWMVSVLGSLSAPARGQSSTFLSIDDGRSRISDTAS
jgi:hypothetical protein